MRDVDSEKALLGQQFAKNLRLRMELQALAIAATHCRALTPQTRDTEPQSFRWAGGQCDRCRELFSALLSATDELSRAARTSSRMAGYQPSDGFRAALLQTRSLREECAAIRQEYRAHVASHGIPNDPK
jgi:hypothetical protein